MNNRATVTGVNKVFLIFTTLYLIFQVIIGILTRIYGIKILSGNYLYIILLINQFVIVLLPVIYYSLKSKLNIKKVFRFNKLKVLPAILIVFISIPAYFTAAMLNNIVVFFLQFYVELPEIPIPVQSSKIGLIISLFVLAVSPAICEELMHRGLFLNAYERRGTIRAVFLSAVIFGIFHFEITNLVGPIFLGVLIAYYVVRTNSLFAGMLAHFLNNAFFVFVQYFFNKDLVDRGSIIITSETLGSITVIGITSLVVVWLLLNAFKKATKGTCVKLPAIGSVKSDIASVFTHWPVVIVITVYLVMLGIYLTTLFIENLSLIN